MIYYGRQDINQDDIEAVRAVLTSDFLTQGPAIERLEKTVASYCGAKYAVAVCNATAALHIACRAAGLKQGDVLWTAPNTFVASANCGLYCGSDVDFVDIDAQTYNMSTQELEKNLHLRRKNRRCLFLCIFRGSHVIWNRSIILPKNMILQLLRMPPTRLVLSIRGRGLAPASIRI